MTSEIAELEHQSQTLHWSHGRTKMGIYMSHMNQTNGEDGLMIYQALWITQTFFRNPKTRCNKGLVAVLNYNCIKRI